MSETKHTYAVRLQVENGKVVSAELAKMAGDGEASFKKLEGGVVRVDDRMSAMTRTILTKVLPAVSAAALGRAFLSAVKSLGDLAEAADKVGISAEKLQVFRELGEEVGIGTQAADSALQNFVKEVGAAQAGMGKLLDVFQAYNIALKDSEGNNRSALAVLDDFADVIAGTGDEQQQLYLATKAFGSEGAAFVAATRNGAAGLREYEQAIRDAGLVIDEELVAKAHEFDEAWSKALRVLTTQLKAFAAEVAASFDINLDQIEARIAELQSGKGIGGIFGQSPESAEKELADLQSLRGLTLRRRGATKVPLGPTPGSIPVVDIGADKKARSEADRDGEKTRQAIKDLKFLNEQLERGSTVRSLYNEALGIGNQELELYNELNKAGVELNTEAGQAIADEVEKRFRLNDVLRENQKQVERFINAADGIGDAFGSAFENASLEGKKFGDVIKDLAKDIQRALFKSFVSNPISETIAGFAKEVIPNLFGGYKAEGGPLEQNKWYIAGEHGPEPVWGGGPGAFATGYGKSGNGSSSGNVNVTVINNTPSSVGVRESSKGGEKSVQVMIDQAVARNIGSPGTATNRSLRKFGATPMTGK